MKITLDLFTHRGEVAYSMVFGHSPTIKNLLRYISFVRYSGTHRCYYVFAKHWSLDALVYTLGTHGITVTYGERLQSELEKELVLSKKQPEQKALISEYLSYLEGLRLSASTVACYGNFITQFIFFLKGKSLEQITNSDIRLFVEEQVRQKNYSISSHRQLISAIKHFADLHLESGIIPEDLTRPKKSGYLPTVLSQQEVLDLLRVTKNLKHRAALALLYSSGLRIGELIALKLSMIDIDRRQLFVKNGKGRKDRVVILAESFIVLFRNYYMTYRPEHYFIENPKGGPYNPASVRQFLKRSCKAAGITKRVTPHTLRHSYATHLIEQGVGLRYVQELLGHAKPETTMIYTHVAKKDLLRIKSPLDQALTEVGTSQKTNLGLPFSDNLSG